MTMQGVNIQLLHCLPEDYVKVVAGIIACDSELVNAGDFVETVSNQVTNLMCYAYSGGYWGGLSFLFPKIFLVFVSLLGY